LYTVIVGNIGTVYSGYDKKEAKRIYDEYVVAAKQPYGRASGEDVVLCLDDEPIEETLGYVE
jgi:hypothetical protein